MEADAAAEARREKERLKRRAEMQLGDGEWGGGRAAGSALRGCGCAHKLCRPSPPLPSHPLTCAPLPAAPPSDSYAECYPAYYEQGTFAYDSDEEGGAAPKEEGKVGAGEGWWWAGVGQARSVPAGLTRAAGGCCTPPHSCCCSHHLGRVLLLQGLTRRDFNSEAEWDEYQVGG